MNTTVHSRQRKRLLSLTPRSKEKLPPLVLLRFPRIRQIYLQWPYLPRTLSPSHLHSLLPRNNPILHGWTSLSSWPAMASWPVMSAKTVSKIICASIAVQKTTSWTPIPRSKPWLYPKIVMLQQLLPRNPWKNRERSPGLCIDWEPYWTSLYSNESNLTQCICSFQFSFTLCFPYFSLDPWSGLP